MTASRRPVAFRDPLLLVPLLYLLVWGTVALAFRPAGDFGVETDFYGDFAHYARMWMEDGPTLMNGFRGPFYYLLLAGAGTLLGDPFLAAKLLSVLGAALGLGFLGATVRNLWGAPQAAVAMLFVASNPVFGEYSYRACSDPVFWALLAAVVWLVTRDGARPGRDWAVAGALAALAYLTRYNGIALLPAAAAAALVGTRPLRGALPRFGAFAAAWLVVASPWLVFVLREAGHPLWNSNYANVAVNVFVDEPGKASNGHFMQEVRFTSLGEVFRVDPGAFLATLAGNAVRNLWNDIRQLLGVPWAVLGLAGLILGAETWFTRRRLAFAVMALFVYVVLLPAFYNPRFMIPLLLWWGAAAGGVLAVLRWLPDRPARARRESRREGKGKGRTSPARRRLSPVAWVVAVVAVCAVAGVARNVVVSQDPERHGGLAVEIRNLARQVRAAGIPVGPGTPIAASKPHIGYYLDAPVIPVPQGSVDALRGSGAHYLLISGIEVMRFPALQSMWVPRDRSQVPRGLDLVGTAFYESTAGRRAATLYAVQDPLPYTDPGPPRPVAEPQEPAPGFGRIDDLRRRLAGWYLRWNANQEDAAGLLDRIDDSLQDRHDILVLRGEAALETGEPARAVEWFTRALDAAPDSTTLRLRRSTAHYLAGDSTAARADLDATLAAHSLRPPTSAQSWYLMGSGYLQRRDYSRAFPFLVQANDTPTPTGRAMRGIAYCWSGLGREDRAAEVLRQRLALHPDDREAAGFLRSLGVEDR